MTSIGDHHQAFAAAMAALGPFEPVPHIAVAVSGGGDSLALLLLLRDWLAPQGGRLTVLSVDHGLRPEAAAECRQVGKIVAALNGSGSASSAGLPIDHHVLIWDGPKPATGLMAAARAARYQLLTTWCRSHDVLHLAVAHHADDQAETVLMRADHGSGASGLAGMSALRCLAGVRLLRPVLGWRKSDLLAHLHAAGLSWIEDPSNRSDRFERVRWRRQLGADADLGPLLHAARSAGQRRDLLERAAASWFAEYGRIDPAGYMTLPLAPLHAVEDDLLGQILRQVLGVIGAADFPPAPAALGQLIDGLKAIRQGGEMSTTLAGCLLVARLDSLTVYREAQACGGSLPGHLSHPAVWDRRFLVRVHLPAVGEGKNQTAVLLPFVAAVGKYGLRGQRLTEPLKAIPRPARETLPALWEGQHLHAVATIGAGNWSVLSNEDGSGGSLYSLDVSFLPNQAATSCGFTVVPAPRHTM